jgi:hypothetical protein
VDKLDFKVKKYKTTIFVCLLITAIFIVIEFRHPYFFFQDDNRDQNLPYYIHNLRALLAGEIPLFNFHQSLGIPVLSCIQSAVFYPVNYLGLALSKLFLGHYFAAMEFIALFHLVAAGAGFYCFMRHFRLAEVSCLFGAIAWPFCGFVMTAGNSWIQIVGYAAFLPWILLFSARLINRFSWQCFLILTLLRLFDLFLGYPPFFAYTVFFDLLTACLLYLTLRRSKPDLGAPGCLHEFTVPFPSVTKFFAGQTCSYLLVAIFALPLLLPAFHQVSISADRQSVISWVDYVQYSYNLRHWVNGLVTPFVSVADAYWCDQDFISHVGYVTLVFAVIAVLGLKSREHSGYIIIFALLAAVSFLWAGDILITKLLYYVPVYNRLRQPFKLQFFTSFYLIVLATFGFSLLAEKMKTLQNGRHWHKIIVPLLLVIHIANFLLLYTILPQHMFSRHLDPVPFDEPSKNEMLDGRVVSVGLATINDGDKRIYGYSAPMLGFDYPTLFGLYGFGGYELLIPEKNSQATFGLRERSVFVVDNEPLDIRTGLPLGYLREWGVKWYIIDRSIPLANIDGLRLVRSDGLRHILFDQSAKAFAYWLDDPFGPKVQWRFTTNSLIMETDRNTLGPLMVNLLYNPFFKARIDDRPVGMNETPDGQMLVTVPEGRHSVVITYCDPYFVYGKAISGVAAICVIALVMVLKIRQRRRLNVKHA